MECKRMTGIYTLVIYVIICLFISKINCFELDISQVLDYSIGSSIVSVLKTTEFQNLYTHKFSSPISLKDIYNGDEKIYFDPLLVNGQLLLSASVIWSFKTPSIVQLNLDNSSVLLLNENDSSLDVQAIFSEKVVTNLSPRIHSKTDVTVDVDLSKFEDYDSNDSKVYVTKLEFADDRFKRFTLRNYNLESTKLGNLLHKENELKTVVKIEVEPEPPTENPPKEKNKKEQEPQVDEQNLEIPNKDKIYSVQVYSFDNFPLLIEVLYTFNKRQFYGYTPEEKWKHVYFPTVQDPTFADLLYNRLNYYGCKNGYKFTIDINHKSDYANHKYKINNYCNLMDEVETIENHIKMPFYTAGSYKHGRYRCFEHLAHDVSQYFVDHLMVGSSVLHLPGIPNIVKCIRVYHHLDKKAYLIVFVDEEDVLHYYTFEEKVWRRDKTVEGVKYDERFTNDIKQLLDELLADDTRQGKKVHKLIIDEEAIGYMSDTVRILSMVDSEYIMDTYKKDKSSKENNKLKVREFDLWWYSYYSDTTTISGFGLLQNVLFAKTLPNCAMRPVKYYTYEIHNFPEGIYVHRIDYIHERPSRDMTVYLYTNALFVYVFRKNYREASDINWKFLTVKPMKVLEKYDTYTKYYEKMKKLNNFDFDISEVVANPINLLPEKLNIKFSRDEIREISTLKYDNKNTNLKRIEFDVSKYKENNEFVTTEGDFETTATIITKANYGIKLVKHEGRIVKEFKDDRTLVHMIKYSLDMVWKNVTIDLYTNTLYNYKYKRNEHIRMDESWILVSKKPAVTTRDKDLEKYFQITGKFENFNFG